MLVPIYDADNAIADTRRRAPAEASDCFFHMGVECVSCYAISDTQRESRVENHARLARRDWIWRIGGGISYDSRTTAFGTNMCIRIRYHRRQKVIWLLASSPENSTVSRPLDRTWLALSASEFHQYQIMATATGNQSQAPPLEMPVHSLSLCRQGTTNHNPCFIVIQSNIISTLHLTPPAPASPSHHRSHPHPATASYSASSHIPY